MILVLVFVGFLAGGGAAALMLAGGGGLVGSVLAYMLFGAAAVVGTAVACALAPTLRPRDLGPPPRVLSLRRTW
ncbi:hypothetical protein [Maritimibacter fusiformis]|uniref:Uncharacterized protein n=1 Tax=Maritimibacter fusiformis TaxID=2603819 RepID=A0A5D0RI17_9RHOB|nr:hypothetical protein [Maritimibacter fusiformis]TYB81247.1 hypothetical protein FVF75_08945 [Maritimibacter fusiformis]